jgi:hypothetical protein
MEKTDFLKRDRVHAIKLHTRSSYDTEQTYVLEKNYREFTLLLLQLEVWAEQSQKTNR